MLFSECIPAATTGDVLQGDVIELRHDDAQGWNKWGVIVTADCDILRDKHGGRLTYIPIVTAKTYLGRFFFPQRLQRLGDSIGEQLVARIRSHHPISHDRALAWVQEVGIDAAVAILGVAEEGGREELIGLGRVYCSLVAAQQRDFAEQWTAFIDARIATDRKARREQLEEQLANQLASSVKNLPGDAFFVSSLGGDRNNGYVCYLRVLREIASSEIALRPGEVNAEVRALRVGHMRSPFKFKLTQQLVAVFASIALPQEYEDMRDQRISELPPTESMETD